jgi:23S rRNA pseudouridine1911/1915/1917 synthase
MSAQTVIIQESDIGERVDILLARKTGITRSQIQKFLERGDILVNETHVDQNYRVRTKDVITVNIIDKRNGALIPEQIPVDILYKDEHLVVVNKPAGMVVYPAAGHSQGTLMNALAYHCATLATMGGPLRPGVVHRLDKDTSGVMVVALTDRAYYDLAEQFKQRTIRRRYLALVFGNLREDRGEIASKIGRSESDRKRMSTRVKRGKEAFTRWKVIQRFRKVTLIEVKLGTGRTHQIRVHFSSIGHPVLGDRTYGNKVASDLISGKRILFPRQMLHAELLGFRHPATGEYLEFSSPPPEDMSQKIQELKHLSPGDN